MVKSLIVTLLVSLSVILSSCTSGVGELHSYISNTSGYQFLYPNGWIQVDVKNASKGVDVVFHDLIERTENLSVIVSPVPNNKTLADLGTPSEVGYRFLKESILKPSELQADLLRAESQENDGKTYYILEYQVKLPNAQERHNLASVTIHRGKLWTFNLSTPQKRWKNVKNLFETVVNSFSVY